ncbi:PAS domain S-box protein [Tautonia rosea]|uniref:PAS domain S-box protein n=1 Tax=Tautonia rosea TaxID=2728037 RepID=UPI001474C610|nr:PAS domain S-box protein [Tautonia rosea]
MTTRSQPSGSQEESRVDWQFRVLAEAIPQIVSTHRADGSCDYINRRFLEFTGLTVEQTLGFGWLSAIHPEDRDECLARWNRAVERGESFKMEYRFLRHDGAARWFLGRTEQLRDHKDRPVHWFTTATDIDDRKRASDQAMHRDLFTRRVLDNLFAFVGVLEPDGTLIEANEAPLRAAGISIEDVRGKKFWDCYWWNHSEQVQRQLMEACGRAARGETVRYDVSVRVAGARRMPIDFQIAPLRDDSGRITHLIPSAVDRVDRERLEEARLEREERFRMALKGAHAGTFDIDVSLDEPPVVTEGVHRIFGFASGEQPKTREFLSRVHPDDRAVVSETIRRSVDQGIGHDIEYRVLRPNGSEVWVASRAEVIHGEDGKASRLIGVLIDVTDRKQTELALRASEERYRTLFESIDEGFCTLEMILDVDGHPIDYRFLETNPAFERHTGLVNAVGKRVLELLPDLEHHWIETYGRIAETGESLRFVEESPVMGRWFEVEAFRIGDPKRRRVALLFTDITERHRAEDALREQEQRLLLALEAGELGFWDWDLASDRVHFGGQWARMLGYELDQIEPHVRSWEYRLHPEDRDRAIDTLNQHLEGRTPDYECEFRLQHDDGTWRWILARGRVVERSPDGRPLRILGTHADVTTRKLAEHALAENRELLQSIIDNAEAAIYAKDLEGRFILSNRHHAGLAGLEPEVLLGQTDAEIGDWASGAETYRANDQRVIEADGPIEFEEVVPTVFGERVFLSVKFPLRDAEGRIHAVCGISTDVTERKHAERAIQEAAERYRLITLATNDIIWDWDLSTNRLSWSPAALHHLGCSPEDLETSIESWYDRIHPEDRRRVVESIHAAIDQNEETWSDEYRFARNDGSYATLLHRGTIARDDERRPSRMIASMLDVSQRRAIEEAMAEAKHLAEAASRAKSEFLANMSHEIRTPMTAILGYAEVLSRQVSNPDDLQCVETIRRNGQHLLAIVNDILDLSRIEAGRLDLDQRRFEPDRLVADVHSMMEVRAREKGLQLRIDFPDRLPQTIESDPTRLRQILVNLVGNAIKFTESGEVCMVVRLEDDPVSPRLRFEIVDTGIGLPADQVHRLFRPFEQLDSSMARRYGGSGLGLAICRRLVELLGGTIAVESELARGSRFFFTIATGTLTGVPMVEPRKPSETARDLSPEEPPRRVAGRVLVVDDRPDIRSLARMFLEDAGARVETAEDGLDAIEVISQSETTGMTFDVVVIDMQMPQVDGYDAVARLRRNGFRRPVIALTASAMRGDRERCLEAGCSDYLPKPIDPRRLVEMVARYAQHRDAPQEPPNDAGQHANPSVLRNSQHERTPARTSHRVLLVDDSADLRRVISRLLEWSGHEVQSAGDGGTALELARTFRPDIVLLDLGLPDITGEELLSQLKQIAGLETVVSIAVTGRNLPADRVRTLSAGFDHHVVKPVDIDYLVSLFPSSAANSKYKSE